MEAADAVWLPFIVIGELRAGFAVGQHGPRNEAVLRRFLLKPGVRALIVLERWYNYVRLFFAAVMMAAWRAATHMSLVGMNVLCLRSWR